MSVEDALMRVQAWLVHEHNLLVPIQQLEWIATDVNWDDTLDPAVVNLTTADQPGEIAELTDLGATEYGALVRDAKRYRWLRSQGLGHCFIERVLFETISDDYSPPYRSLKHTSRLDAAIDAAMEAAK